MEIKDLNNLLDNAINLQKKQRRRTVFVVIIIALIGGLLFYGSNFFTAKTVTEKIQKDSSTANPIYKNVVKKQNEDISMIIESYFHARASKNLDEVANYYSDTTFDFFYSYPNQFMKNVKTLNKKEVLKIDKVDFNKKNINDIRTFDFTEIISVAPISNSNNLVVFVKGRQFSKEKMYDSILEVKLKSKDKKIYSIRSYIDVFRKM